MDGIATACQREAAWLATTADDGLPVLPASAGGPWDVVQAFWPGQRTATQKRGIYVCFQHNSDARPNAARVRQQHTFALKLTWPVKTGTSPIAETEQANFAEAIEALIERIRGPFGDKTHGGQFESVGEVPPGLWPEVTWEDAERTIPGERCLRASVVYRADDLEVMG